MTFISETNDRVKKQTLTKYVTTFEYADKTLDKDLKSQVLIY